MQNGIRFLTEYFLKKLTKYSKPSKLWILKNLQESQTPGDFFYISSTTSPAITAKDRSGKMLTTFYFLTLPFLSFRIEG